MSAPDLRVARPPPPTPDARPRPTHGLLLVTLGPWCDLFLDDRPLGKSPMQRPARVPPGQHVLECRNGPGGASTRRQVTVVAGEQATVSGPIVATITVRLQLTRGDAVQIEGRVYRGTFTFGPVRRRVDLLRGGVVVPGEGAYVSFPPRACTLVDHPRLECR